MNTLLRWGIENSTHGEQASQQLPGQPGWSNDQQTQLEPKKFDTGIIDAILGRPDSEVMKESLEVAKDEGRDEDDRLTALDNFEMLIEQIDNANNIDKMGMWPSLQALLSSASSSDDIRAAVLWIIGTATQNNPAAQKAYLAQPDSPMSAILQRLSPKESSKQTRSRAVYALSGLLKHNAVAVKLLEGNDGWKILKNSLQDPEISVRRKAVFLLGSLLLPNTPPTTSSHPVSSVVPVSVHSNSTAVTGHPSDPEPQPEHPNSHMGMTPEATATSETTSAAIQGYGIAGDLVQGLVSPIPHGVDGDQEGDADFEEKSVRLFYTYLTTVRGALEESDKTLLSTWFRDRREKGENWDLTDAELDELQHALKLST